MTAFSCFIHLKWPSAATFVALIFLKLAYSLHDVRTFAVGQPCIPNSNGAICQTNSAHAENLPNLGSQTKTWATERSQPQNRANQQTLEYKTKKKNNECSSYERGKDILQNGARCNFITDLQQPSESAVKYYTCVPDKTSSTCGVWKLKKCPQNKRFKFSKQACDQLHYGRAGYGMPNYGMDFMSYGYGGMGYPMQVNYPGFSVIPPPVPLPPANQGAGNAPPPPPNQPQAPPAGSQPQMPAPPPATPPAAAPPTPPEAAPPAAPQPPAPAAPGKTPSAKPSLPGGLPKPKLPGKLPIPGKG
ncbi:hypothetical protein T02_10405 [Trichinella nativa]|uniref:IgA FC receptor n=1 Tax=Trichinella nativa TaxID=6335 RepID=A0A0V1LGP4_9BILA|nr:hypothetical protein T02_10405 [Trichinella nativa]